MVYGDYSGLTTHAHQTGARRVFVGRQAWDELVRRHARAVWKVLVSYSRLSPGRPGVHLAGRPRSLHEPARA